MIAAARIVDRTMTPRAQSLHPRRSRFVQRRRRPSSSSHAPRAAKATHVRACACMNPRAPAHSSGKAPRRHQQLVPENISPARTTSASATKSAPARRRRCCPARPMLPVRVFSKITACAMIRERGRRLPLGRPLHDDADDPVGRELNAGRFPPLSAQGGQRGSRIVARPDRDGPVFPRAGSRAGPARQLRPFAP